MTHGSKSQYRYDKFISELDLSSLRFLRHKYINDLSEYRRQNNLNNSKNAQEYKMMQQRLKMINEEIKLREQCDLVRHDPDIYFDGDFLIVTYPSGITKKFDVLEVDDNIILREIHD